MRYAPAGHQRRRALLVVAPPDDVRREIVEQLIGDIVQHGESLGIRDARGLRRRLSVGHQPKYAALRPPVRSD
jgi:hypothetical protein